MQQTPDSNQKEFLSEDLRPYIGAEAFTVLIDDSCELLELTESARKLRDLPFREKLETLKTLSLGAMSNAYEAMHRSPEQTERERCKGLVFQKHPLSAALKRKSGCCRYQGALFFILAFEAQLGDRHFLQAAPVVPGMNTVFNEVYDGENNHKISIFSDSLTDKSLDYSRQNPRVFDSAFVRLPGYDFYSYHRTPSGIVMVANQGCHLEKYSSE